MAVLPVDQGQRLAMDDLPVAQAVRAGQQIGEGGADRDGLARRKLRVDLSLQRDMGDAAREGGGAPVHHSPNIAGKAPRMARAPWPAPPFGRPGASLGVWP
ncbi:hypothetical protein MASR1M32_42120 [Rhodobacter sp.]